uniref:Uncharacterized protein n=1 Tax=Arundo donax TaxID=35708 RepID=A0A0A9DPN5_ARUDO
MWSMRSGRFWQLSHSLTTPPSVDICSIRRTIRSKIQHWALEYLKLWKSRIILEVFQALAAVETGDGDWGAVKLGVDVAAGCWIMDPGAWSGHG